ncbi:GNAT family N-acetyltransferase [Cytobacillus purgationiresistens]|uniref:GNAT superfamily N-acetyltransferase n=1 Tax=Cytobacillus purgationiresistens TaxID=863449 RepID=A0ABU0AD00_9BACI|nr:GNAT family N-acetyltransferase [Cytobacillus purgationiresistens]MDQ0268308.1 GNAT superfamily N-acetyltransferase [Cytobacillus purgationiresistens]
MKRYKDLAGKELNLLNGLPTYIFIEEKDDGLNHLLFSSRMGSVLSLAKEQELVRIGVLLIKNNDLDYIEKRRELIKLGFHLFSTNVTVKRNLGNADFEPSNLVWKTIAKDEITVMEFQSLWERCKNPGMKIDAQMQSVKSELGHGWEKYCMAAFDKEVPIGISIPHIEPGTEDEGRLFYFGILPEQRGKGFAAKMHADSLQSLISIGASYYIGSTAEENTTMVRVFLRNGCLLNETTEVFYLYLKNHER